MTTHLPQTLYPESSPATRDVHVVQDAQLSGSKSSQGVPGFSSICIRWTVQWLAVRDAASLVHQSRHTGSQVLHLLL